MVQGCLAAENVPALARSAALCAVTHYSLCPAASTCARVGAGRERPHTSLSGALGASPGVSRGSRVIGRTRVHRRPPQSPRPGLGVLSCPCKTHRRSLRTARGARGTTLPAAGCGQGNCESRLGLLWAGPACCFHKAALGAQLPSLACRRLAWGGRQQRPAARCFRGPGLACALARLRSHALAAGGGLSPAALHSVGRPGAVGAASHAQAVGLAP